MLGMSLATATAVGYTALVLVAGCVTFVVYGWDKRQAVRQSRRVSEKTLHSLALVGGWLGAWLGQRVFRHKTQKLGFQGVFWATVVLHTVCISLIAYWCWHTAASTA